MFLKDNLKIISIDGIECFIPANMANESTYTTGYDGVVTYDMIHPILLEMMTGFSGAHLSQRAEDWNYHRMFLHKYIPREVTSKMSHPIKAQMVPGTDDIPYLLHVIKKFQQIDGFGRWQLIGGAQFKEVPTKYFVMNTNSKDPAVILQNPYCLKLVEKIIELHDGVHPSKEYISSKFSPIDFDIFESP